jgi:hypothetical protein
MSAGSIGDVSVLYRKLPDCHNPPPQVHYKDNVLCPPLYLISGYLEKWSFCSNSALFKKFYPRNINYMPVVKFSSLLDLEQKS